MTGLTGRCDELPRPIMNALTKIDVLTQREVDVLDLLGEGLSNQQIARRLRISEPTVRAHVTHLLAKLGVRSRLQAGLVGLLSRWPAPSDAASPPAA